MTFESFFAKYGTVHVGWKRFGVCILCDCLCRCSREKFPHRTKARLFELRILMRWSSIFYRTYAVVEIQLKRNRCLLSKDTGRYVSYFACIKKTILVSKMKILQLAASALLLATSHAANNSGVSSKLMVHVSERPLKKTMCLPKSWKKTLVPYSWYKFYRKCRQTNPLTVFFGVVFVFVFVFFVGMTTDPPHSLQGRGIRASRSFVWNSTLWRSYCSECILRRFGFVWPHSWHNRRLPNTS